MTYTSLVYDTLPVPAEPAVLSCYVIGPDTATVDQAIYVPWRNCRLEFAYAVTTKAEGNVNAVALVFELDAASGTEIGGITVAQNSSVGDIDEISFTAGTTAYDARNHLDRGDTSRDAINIQTTSAGTTGWEGMVYMYFVRDDG